VGVAAARLFGDALFFTSFPDQTAVFVYFAQFSWRSLPASVNYKQGADIHAATHPYLYNDANCLNYCKYLSLIVQFV